MTAPTHTSRSTPSGPPSPSPQLRDRTPSRENSDGEGARPVLNPSKGGKGFGRTPFAALLDLDRGRLPRLRLRLDGSEYPVRVPEALPLADAFRLGDLFRALHEPAPAPNHSDPDHSDRDRDDDAWDQSVDEIARLVVPDLPAPLSPGHARSIVAFYSRHLATAIERLTTPSPTNTAGDPIPFSAPTPASGPPPASAHASAAACVSSSPCP